MTKKCPILIVCFLITACALSGCATWKSIPNEAKVSNPFFNASLSTKNFQEFTLKMQNKTDNNIKILWNKTLYIDPSGGTNEWFTFGNESSYEQINLIPQPTIVFPHETLERKICPVAKRYWRNNWKWDYMPVGKNGVFLTTVTNGKEVTERLILEFVSSN